MSKLAIVQKPPVFLDKKNTIKLVVSTILVEEFANNRLQRASLSRHRFNRGVNVCYYDDFRC